MTCIAAGLFRFIGDDVTHHIVLTELAVWFAVGLQHLHDNRADLIGSDHVDEGARPGEVVLLAIPHYLILALLIGGFASTTGDASNMTQSGVGLIGVLVLVAGVTLIFTLAQEFAGRRPPEG